MRLLEGVFLKKLIPLLFVAVLIISLASAAYADGSFSVEDGYVVGTYTAEGSFIDIKVNGGSARADIGSVTIKYSPAEEVNTVEVYVDGALAHTYSVTESGAEEVASEPISEYVNEFEAYGVVIPEEDDDDTAETVTADSGADVSDAEAGEAEADAGDSTDTLETGDGAAQTDTAAAAGSVSASPKTGYIIGAAACVVVIIVVVLIMIFSGRKKSKH